jgi:phage terminase Nu1 subunit (DNA packaging protein)
MPALTISEAAAALGFKSRSTLYRLRDNGDLDAYLTPAEPTGRRLLEMAPAGLPSLRDHIAQLVRLQANSSLGGRQPQAPPTQGRSTHPGDGDQPPNLNDERARHEREKRLMAEMERKLKEKVLVYRQDMETAYSAVILQVTTRAESLHKQINIDIPHLTHTELEKIQRRISDVFEAVASHDYEELAEWSNDGDTEELPDYAVSRSRAEYEKANLLELERKTREGLLLRREDAEQAWGSAVNITRNRLLGVPSAAKQRIPHLELEEVELLTTLIRDALEELAAGDLKA